MSTLPACRMWRRQARLAASADAVRAREAAMADRVRELVHTPIPETATWQKSTTKESTVPTEQAGATPEPGVAPFDLYAYPDTDIIMLEWQEATSNGGGAVIDYNIYRDGILIKTENGIFKEFRKGYIISLLSPPNINTDIKIVGLPPGVIKILSGSIETL